MSQPDEETFTQFLAMLGHAEASEERFCNVCLRQTRQWIKENSNALITIYFCGNCQQYNTQSHTVHE